MGSRFHEATAIEHIYTKQSMMQYILNHIKRATPNAIVMESQTFQIPLYNRKTVKLQPPM